MYIVVVVVVTRLLIYCGGGKGPKNTSFLTPDTAFQTFLHYFLEEIGQIMKGSQCRTLLYGIIYKKYAFFQGCNGFALGDIETNLDLKGTIVIFSKPSYNYGTFLSPTVPRAECFCDPDNTFKIKVINHREVSQ